MSLESLINRVKERPYGTSIQIDGMDPMTSVCSFAEVPASEEEVGSVAVKIPDDLRDFWRIARDARLFEDTTYGQWGLHLLSPSESLRATQKFQLARERDSSTYDLVVGRFLGDSELLLVRCDPSELDYGQVWVALPLDRREEWFRTAISFEAFLESYVDARGAKFWEQR